MLVRSVGCLAIVLLSACASASPTPPPPPPAAGRMLAYAQPATPAVSYAFTDSSAFEIQGGAIGEIRINISGTGTADVAFAQKAAELEATIRVTDFAGSMRNTVASTGQTATESDIQGVALVSLSARGESRITQVPNLSPTAQRVGIGESFFRRFFVHLPARQVRPGATWVDTVSTTDEGGPTKISVTDIITAKFVKDSIVGGRAHALITTATRRTLNITGVSDGGETTQRLTGSGTGTILWDIERGLLAERLETSELNGTFDLPEMGIAGLPMIARGSARIVLR